jgi:hypothetical protein
VTNARERAVINPTDEKRQKKKKKKFKKFKKNGKKKSGKVDG